jgi:membrane protease subunit HflK
LLLDSILYNAAARTLAAMSVDDALTTRRAFVSQETMRLAQAEIDRLRLGIQLLAFETRELNPPTQVMQSFQDVVSAKVEAKTLIEPANSYRASVIPQAATEAYRMQQEAGAYAKQLIAKAQGEVFSFLALLKEYNANPVVIRARLYAEMIETVMPKMRISTILPSSTDELRLVLSPQITFSRVGEEQSPAPASVNTLTLQTEPVYDDK